MKFRRVLAVLVVAVALTSPVTLTLPAEAAVPRKPITCGMVVQDTMDLYLAKDLYCPDTAVQIGQDSGRDEPVVPTVNVDLGGHTLRGSGTGFGIWNHSYPGQAIVRIKHGVIRGFQNGVAGDSDTTVSGLTLASNGSGFFCNEGCRADLTVFKNNGRGMVAAGESNATVTRSLFMGNDVGATVSFIWTLKIDRSLFIQNKTGVEGSNGRPTVSNTVFLMNDTAVTIVTEDPTDPEICASLTKVTFAANEKNLLGPRCKS